MKRFYKFMFFIDMLIIIAFVLLFFRNEITGVVNAQTGMNIKLPEISFEWVAFWKNGEAENAVSESNALNSNEQQTLSNISPSANDDNSAVEESTFEAEQESSEPTSAFDARLKELDGNTVVGINYSGISCSPEALATSANTIYKVKIKAINPVVSENLVKSEITAKVEKVYKGRNAKTIQIVAYGGVVNKDELLGQMKISAGKTDNSDNKVTVLMDFCNQLEEGKSYIVFANSNNGILYPVSGNMSFFRVKGSTVTRISREDEIFTMKLKDFEKSYLE